MPILCDELSNETLLVLNKRIAKLPSEHPLRKEGNTIVTKYGDYVIFQSEAGLYFRRIVTNIEAEIRKEIDGQREYLCSVFEVDAGDPSVVEKLRVRFQESHGLKLARQIEDCVIQLGGKQLMLVKFPSSVLRHMLEPTGGFLRTGFSGLRGNLRQIPTLVQFCQVPSGDDGDFVKSAIVTEYKEEHYHSAKAVHYNILREVVTKPNLGITLYPFAVWDS
jgi:hypothetical protein